MIEPINRRSLLKAFPSLALLSPLLLAKKKPAAELPIAIASRFVYQGQSYGMAIPIFEPGHLAVLERIQGHEYVFMNDQQIRITIRMLEDLLVAKREAQQSLATKKA